MSQNIDDITKMIEELSSDLEKLGMTAIKNEFRKRGLMKDLTQGYVKKLASVKLTEEACTIWYCNRKVHNVDISDDQLKATFMKFFKKYDGTPEFIEVDEWIQFWKTYNELKNDQIFLGSVMGPLEKKLSSSTTKITTKSGTKAETFGKVGIIACFNTSGSVKMPLLVADNKFIEPDGNLTLDRLPVKYMCCDDDKLLSVELLEKWFTNEFIPRVKYYLNATGFPKKAILFVNSLTTSTMKIIDVDEIRLVLAPKDLNEDNKTFETLGEKVNNKVRVNYSKNLQATLAKMISRGLTEDQALNSLDMKHLIYLLHEAWNEIKLFDITEFLKSK